MAIEKELLDQLLAGREPNEVYLKGAVSRVAEGETAFGNRQASHAIHARRRMAAG